MGYLCPAYLLGGWDARTVALAGGGCFTIY